MGDWFDLSVLDSGNPAQLVALARCGNDLAIELLPCQDLAKLMEFRKLLVAAASGTAPHPPSVSQLVEFGEQLFRFVVRGVVQHAYDRLPNTHIRVHILSNHPVVQALPWEYLKQPQKPAGPNRLRSVVRIVPTVGIDPTPPIKLNRAIRLLFVYADPIDQDFVDWPDIKSTIEREFSARLPESFQMTMVEGVSRQSLLDALNQGSYNILHFAGHGEEKNGEGRLLFKGVRSKRTDPVSAADLAVALQGTGLGLIVLSACSTSSGDFAKEFAVVAKTLIEAGIPAVVANQFPVTNNVAATFAAGFYQELLRSGDVDLATTNGRVGLAFQPPLPGGAARLEWGIPSLYRHFGAAQVFLP